MAIFDKMRAARQKRVETRNDRKVKIASAQYESNNIAYENGVTPQPTENKWAKVAETGLGIVKGYLGGNKGAELPLPVEETGPNKILLIGGGVAALLVVAVIMKKK